MVSIILAATLACGDLCSPEAVSIYARLTTLAASQRYSVERAAFVVRTSDGRLLARTWSPGEERSATWRGRIPSGCIAIAHTHPVAAPMPSRADVAEAQRLGIPIVVVSLHRVTVAGADGSQRELLPGGWQRNRR